MKRILVVGTLVAALMGGTLAGGGVAQPDAAQASTHNGMQYIDGKCGMHRGNRVIPYLHRYHVTIHACSGYVHIILCSPADWPCRRFDWWKSYNPVNWNWVGIIDVGTWTAFTAASCAGFAAAFTGEVPSGGLDTAITAAAGAGCVTGGSQIQDAIDRNFGTRK